MRSETRCAACGKVVVPMASTVTEGEHRFCDKICRASFHQGNIFAPPPQVEPVPKAVAEKQVKYSGRLIEGIISILLGFILTWWSRSHDYLKGYYIIFYGPVLWGIIALAWGGIGLWQTRKSSTRADKYMK